MADLSVMERATDVYEKVMTISRVLTNILPGGSLRFGTETVRGVPTRVFLNLPDTLGE